MAVQTLTRKPLVIGIPGSFDSADYSSYASWLKYLPELGADVRILDMLQLSGVTQIAQGADGMSYYCDWRPEDYTNLILSTIDELQPTQVVLLGFGFGAYEAIRSGFILSQLGRPVTGVVSIAPHTLAYTTSEYHEIDNPYPEVELRRLILEKAPLIDESQHSGRLLSCVRYDDLYKPHNGARRTFYIPEHVLDLYKKPLSRNLHTDLAIRKQGSFTNASEILHTPQYTVPTALVATSKGWYLPAANVSALARRSRRAPTSYNELRVCYDFRTSSSATEQVTETIMHKVGQLITTGTVRQPRPSRTLLAGHEVHNEESVGTIVLSSARPPYYYRHALQLAKKSATDLMVLASHDLDAGTVAADMINAGVKGCVIDVPKNYKLPLTTGYKTLEHPHTVDRKGNLSVKRNIGLLYGRLTGQNLFFLDDDIRGLSTKRLRRVGAQLSRHTIAGFLATNYPDNSVVCHANRLSGSVQANFISGSSLGVNAANVQSFFLNIYNEDWLFCHDAIQDRNIVLMGDVRQLSYKPFDPERAASEEFGDVLAEGLNYLFTVGASLEMANEDFWRYYLWQRRKFIADIAKRLAALPGHDHEVVQAFVALGASRQTLATFTPQSFVSYIHAWRHDLNHWNSLRAVLPQNLSAQEALQFASNKLGLKVRIIGR